MSKQKLFEHDCDRCDFLGSYRDSDGRDCDLYYADHGGTPDTVIARYSNEGSDYMSGMPFADGTVDSLTEAKCRAIDAGFIEAQHTT
jgi:hypothetical protein